MASETSRTRLLIILLFAATVLAISLLVWRMSAKRNASSHNVTVSTANDSQAVPPSIAQTPDGSPTPPQVSEATQPPSNTSSSNSPSPQISPSPLAPTESRALIIPVTGVSPEQLQDTFTASRSAGRTHDAIDIIAARGTPVLAAADGTIVKLFLSKPGGITIYQLSVDQKMIYYYAHLERYADGLSEGHFARQGEVIGYVGDTGNAWPGNYHLHFSIMLVKDPARYWDGVNINPYPLLKSQSR